MLNIFIKVTLGILIASVSVSTAFAVGPKKVWGEMSEKAATRPGFLKKIFDSKGRAAIGTCTVTAIVDTTLTCTKDSKSYTILSDEKTQFRRRFWGKGSLSEILAGHVINVIGTWTDDEHTTIQARLVRDTSIQKRFGVFFGEVKTILPDGWIMTTVSGKRADQTVTVSSSTKFVNRKEEPISQSQILVGHKVRVKGLWDNLNNTITEVRQAKDFTLPVISATVTGTPTATPTP